MDEAAEPIRLKALKAHCLRASEEEIVAQYGESLLVATQGQAQTPAEEPEWAFQTRTNVAPYRRKPSTGTFVQLFADESIVLPLNKKRTGAFHDTVLIGRASSNDLCIDDPSVSKLHARIQKKPDGSLLLSDAGSRNGTWLNSKPVTDVPTPIAHSDEVAFGDCAFTVFRTARLYLALRGYK